MRWPSPHYLALTTTSSSSFPLYLWDRAAPRSFLGLQLQSLFPFSFAGVLSLPSPPADVFFAAVHRVVFLFLNCPVLAMWSRRFYSRQRSTLVLGIALCGEAFQKRKKEKKKAMYLDVWDHCRCLCEMLCSANSLFSTTAVVIFPVFGVWSRRLPKSMRFFALTSAPFGSGCGTRQLALRMLTSTRGNSSSWGPGELGQGLARKRGLWSVGGHSLNKE